MPSWLETGNVDIPDLDPTEEKGIHPSRAAGFWVPRVVTSVHGDR